MQLGFPDMGAVFVDQRDERALSSAIAMTQSGRKFQTASATTHDDNFVLFAHSNARDQVGQFGPRNQATWNAASYENPRWKSLNEFGVIGNPNAKFTEIGCRRDLQDEIAWQQG
ncbi:hypothetical protein [Limnohabitans sp. 2KL-27]|uniref:hypothetical protein n=1 Tax=Limnohabitans sp. 2KL-27 TaxID=1100705 RepID=UPI001E3182EC|nr:hypothetical protein [Limnohabitans sp. 2KL-27]